MYIFRPCFLFPIPTGQHAAADAGQAAGAAAPGHAEQAARGAEMKKQNKHTTNRQNWANANA